MSNKTDEFRGAARQLLAGDEVQAVLSGSFYTPAPNKDSADNVEKAPKSNRPVARPEHYKVICISMYTKDLDRLDAMVETLKSRGMTKANRSALIRVALDQLDLDKVPRGMG
ncbi:MAG: hypothetical protein U0165_19925 [Polyangiaceae bacterium]